MIIIRLSDNVETLSGSLIEMVQLMMMMRIMIIEVFLCHPFFIIALSIMTLLLLYQLFHIVVGRGQQDFLVKDIKELFKVLCRSQ